MEEVVMEEVVMEEVVMEAATKLPKVSVITTFRNAAAFLQRAIDSVLAQTYFNLELILFDDGSTDSSRLIARASAESDCRVKLIESSKVGRSRALINAHAAASGSYVGWLDADDYIQEACIEKSLLAISSSSRASFTYTLSRHEDLNGGISYPSVIPYSELRLLTHFVTTHFRLIKLSSFEKAGAISPAFPIAIDYDLCLRLEEVGEVICVPEFLHTRGIHRGQMSYRSCVLQHHFSVQAVQNAIKRRGLDSVLSLKHKLVSTKSSYLSRFSLKDI